MKNSGNNTFRSVFLLSLISLVCGCIGGFYTAVKLFAIDIDLLGVPYSNVAVVTRQDMHLTQNQFELTIPKGASIIYSYSTQSVPVYSLPIVGDFEDDLFDATNASAPYFWVKSVEK